MGGTADHIHLLLSLPTSLSIADAIRLIKGNSAQWINNTIENRDYFQWQKGYGAFSIGISQVKHTIAYINGQKEHHKQMTLIEECELFLKKHKMNFNGTDS